MCVACVEAEGDVDPLVAGRGDHVNGWQPIAKSKNLQMQDVCGSGYMGETHGLAIAFLKQRARE
jgi:hypothetical protein